MTADELARVTAERDAAVAALARVEALADEWERNAGPDSSACKVFGPQIVSVVFALRLIRDALAGAEGDAGAEVAPGATDDVTGAQIGAPTWAGLFGIDPDFTDGKDIDEWLRENRGNA